jgi:hypothetical protein
MPIFEVRPDGLTPVPATSFETVGIRERNDLQRLLREQIECLESGLMVLTEEFSWWVDSTRRIDLLCLDTDANLVIVELKRDETGGHMELQALRYAAMVSDMTFEQAVHSLATHRSRVAPDLAKARADILEFLSWDEVEEENFAQDTRIILAAADFSRELTTSVLWLRERDIDIRCVRLRPYRQEDGRLLVDIHPLIPLPEAEEFQTKLGEKRVAERKERAEQDNLQLQFMQSLSARVQSRGALHAGRVPNKRSELMGSIGRAGFSINYITKRHDTRVELLLQTKDAKEQLHKLMQNKKEIEDAFGGPLEWQEKATTTQCRVFHTVQGGFRSPPEEWSRIHDELIDAMARLEAALKPQVAQLA